jgi:hypothetical protein
MRTSRRLFFVPTLAMLAGCPERTAVWVVPGSTASHLELAVGPKRGKEKPMEFFLRVDRCEDPERGWIKGTAFWITGTNPRTGSYPSRVLYGTTGPGLESQEPAQELTPGCYLVTMSGTGRTAFLVDSIGRVIELDSIPPKPDTTRGAA